MAFKLLVKKSTNALAQGTLDLGELGLRYTTELIEGNTVVTGGQLYVGLGATNANGYAAISMVGHTHNLAAITANASGSNFAVGDIVYASGITALTTLGKGNDGQVLTVTSGLPSWATPAAINDGTLTFSIGAAAATNNTVTVATGTGFSANTATNATYQISVGPALTNLATTMTSTNLGFLKKTAADTYTLDTSTYLTAEADTLDSVTGRGASTTNSITVGDIAVNGGNVTTNQTTASIFDTAATTVNAFGAATTLTLGNDAAVASTTNIAIGSPTSGTKTINVGTGGASGSTTNITLGSATSGAISNITLNGAVGITDDLAVNGGDITTSSGTFNLLNTNATTINFGGAATTVNIGAATGTATIKNANVVLDGDLAVNGGDITTSSEIFNIGNTASTAQTINLGTAATATSTTKEINIGTGGASGSTTNITIGSTVGGTLTLNSPSVVIPGNLTVTGTVTTNNVQTVSTTNGVIFEGTEADDNELTLIAGVLTGDRTITLPDTTGTVALTSQLITTFLGLSDTPEAYTSTAKQLVGVNASANALEFVNELDCGTW
jgi:hypothetical protein